MGGSQPSINVNVEDSEGYAPLCVAVLNRSYRLIDWLVEEKGADVNATGGGWRTASYP